MKKIEELVTKEEIRRLQKAARDGNKEHLKDWIKQFDFQVHQQYERWYKEELEHSIDNLILTIIYTLHFNEKTRFGNARLTDFMEDLLETIDMFRREEAKPEDYRKQLKDDGIIIKNKESK